jgi:hypothetical protein
MSSILNSEEFVAIEQAVKAGVALQPVAAAFSELSTLRAELKNWASRRVITSKP